MEDFEGSENMSNEIMSSMKLKDEIISELYNKLEFEMNENTVLRNKFKESNQIREEYSDDENKEQRIKISVKSITDPENEKMKLLADINTLKEKIAHYEKANTKSQNLNEIEAIFKKQIDSLSHKLEISEKRSKEISALFEEKDKHINELLQKIKKYEKENESSTSCKDMEIYHLNSKLSLKSLFKSFIYC